MLRSFIDPLSLLPQSLVERDGMAFGLARLPQGPRLAVLSNRADTRLHAFDGDCSPSGDNTLLLAALTAANAAALREQLPWLKPALLGLNTSAGLGDRMGLATPGHVRAARRAGGRIRPIFAQQSIREMARTGRSPQQVMDDATWGIFQEGWQDGHGADADHLKTPQDIDDCLAAGYTFFTIDPGEYVDNSAETAGLYVLRETVGALPEDLRRGGLALLGKSFHIEQLNLTFEELALLRAMAKYGHAIWHVAGLYRHLLEKAGAGSFELEVSVDETAQPTTHLEHVYIASELQRLGVEWVSLAPRYIGEFEKGVDYIGDVAAFEQDIAGHAAIARHFGPYKLSLHSGSDKFSIYPAAMRQTQGLVHLKTAGTSYLEALRTLASIDPDFLREIYVFARERYETDRKTYHVSAQLSRAPLPTDVRDWAGLLNQFDAREILHVTFGSVLKEQSKDGQSRFSQRLFALLRQNPELYARNLEMHFTRHLDCFLSAWK